MPPRQPAYNPAVKTTPLATVSLVLGILSLIGFFCFLSWIMAIAAIVLGVIAMSSIRNSNGLLKGTGLAVTGIVLSVLGISLAGAMFLFVSTAEQGPKVINYVDQAERKISVKSGDKIGFGNSPEAEALAEQFAEQLSLMRQLGIEGGDKNKPSLSGGEFLTFCQLDEDSCAFLVHVPDFRNFEGDAKEFINNSAWGIAQQLLKESSLPEGAPLAVATRGVLLYDEINIGRHLKNIEDDADARHGIDRTPVSESSLDAFFPEPKVIEPEPGPDDAGAPD